MKIRYLSLLTIIVALLLLATQCGAAKPGIENPAPAKVAPAAVTAGAAEQPPGEAIKLSAVDLAEGEKLKVVATTTIIGDMARNVGGDMIELTTMLPIGADPHTFDPTPSDVAAVAGAHVVLMNGLHLEEFLAELIQNAGGEAPAVALSTNVDIRESGQVAGNAAGDGVHYHEGGADPHVWLNPANAIVMVQNIEQALSQLDPANAAAYAVNADSYQAELEALDGWVAAQIGTIPEENRKMVTDHGAFGYYADRYGLEVVGTVLPAYSTNAEPSAQELADLEQAIGDLGVKAVFVGTTVNPILAERVAQDTGIKLVPLYTGSLGESGSGAATYLDYIRYNTRAIVDGLK